MARGWESKSVESQMESAAERPSGAQPMSDADKEKQREKQSLLLSRAYVQHQMESASNPKYAESLRKALAEIDSRLDRLHGS